VSEPRLPIDDAIRRRVGNDLHTTFLVEAGAGTGKTRVLVDRYVSCLTGDDAAPIGAVVAITFTEKAAGELRQRVRGRLERLLAGGKMLGDGREPSPADFRLLSDALKGLDDAPISTIHAFAARLLRERFLADPYRPRYHFCVPEDMGMPGDPNGAFYYNGCYHLMYLYNRNGSGFCWGHISSGDLVHWRHHPDAIGPGQGDEGCFSGGAFVDDDGSAYLSYWMLWGAKGIGLATSRGPDFDTWTKLPANPVIKIHRVGHHRGQSRGREDLPLRLRRSVEHLEEGWPLLHPDRQSAGAQQDWPRARRAAVRTGRSALPVRLGQPEGLEISARVLRAQARVDRPQRGRHVPELPAVALET